MRQSAGFTLIELVVALAIVALLAGFAIPSYRQHVAQGHRASAVAALYRAAQHLETLDGALPSSLPDGLARAPAEGRAVYRLRMRRPDGDSFIAYALEAQPLAPGPMRDDRCGVFSLRSDGTKGNVLAGGVDEWEPACWGLR
ncbi:hypothetical protein LIG30_1857 [Burkholderia sp. lig30]|jgi:type IV pilus assembly protein PilE|uniref:type IV pilin protein n=1 Tax=Burkholderia sp. lig30 TaxID=1192124 RepID=UPI0004617917|nr:type IV pilin protein [Burkholderia sp. lig30]KDB09105.1 hypothetical protein LIG30_1857 [Burkholderia sp. lig30]